MMPSGTESDQREDDHQAVLILIVVEVAFWQPGAKSLSFTGAPS